MTGMTYTFDHRRFYGHDGAGASTGSVLALVALRALAAMIAAGVSRLGRPPKQLRLLADAAEGERL